MSDNNSFGSAGTAVAEPPVDESIATVRSLSPKLLVAVVGGVLLVAVAAYFLLFSGGGGDDTATGAVPQSTAHASAGSQAPSASAKPVTSSAPKTVSGGNARDPFAPLVVPVTSATASAATSTGTGGTSGSTSGTALPSGLVETVTLVKLNATAVTADVTVNGVKYSGVARGAVFAKYFSLNIITGSTQAQFLFGDSTLPLTVGHSVTVRT